MIGLVAALIAIYLGAAGPRFRWRGALLLGAAAIAIGLIATMLAASDAAEQRLSFAITPGSLLIGLALQSAFMLTFYGMAALARWSARGLTAFGQRAPHADGEM